MAVCNNSVKTDLVQVRCLELQHLVNASSVNLVCCLGDLLGRAIGTAEASRYKLLSELVEQVEGVEVSTGRDLNELCETVADLSLWKSTHETKVQESVHGCVVSTETVLVVAIVDGNLDRDRSIDQTNDGGWDADVVGVASVRSTSESMRRLV